MNRVGHAARCYVNVAGRYAGAVGLAVALAGGGVSALPTRAAAPHGALEPGDFTKRVAPASPSAMRTPTELRGVTVTWLGHACFEILPAKGPRVVVDPFGAMVGTYPWTPPQADVVLVTHEHPDHNAADRVAGHPVIIRGVGLHKVGGVGFNGIAAFHDNDGGKERGVDTLFAFTLGRIRFLHLGDLGQDRLTPAQLAQIGKVDVLFIPVGGFFTIDAAHADAVVAQLRPRVVIPMHYKTRYTAANLPLVGVDGFLRGKKGVHALKGSTETFSWASLPRATRIDVFAPPQ